MRRMSKWMNDIQSSEENISNSLLAFVRYSEKLWIRNSTSLFFRLLLRWTTNTTSSPPRWLCCWVSVEYESSEFEFIFILPTQCEFKSWNIFFPNSLACLFFFLSFRQEKKASNQQRRRFSLLFSLRVLLRLSLCCEWLECFIRITTTVRRRRRVESTLNSAEGGKMYENRKRWSERSGRGKSKEERSRKKTRTEKKLNEMNRRTK